MIENGFSLERFFDLQLSQWPETQQRYRDLENVQTKELRTGGLTLMAQFNPARIRSTGASITKQALAERPCFLCKENRPKEQLGLPLTPSDWRGNVTPLALAVEASPSWERLEGALVNPFPILPMHFTLPTQEHQPQRIKPLFSQMLSLLTKYPELTVFYNGPRCGASAPDHAHLQAGTTGVLPLQKEWTKLTKNLKIIAQPDDDTLMAYMTDYPCTAIVICSKTTQTSEKLFMQLYDSLPVIDGDEEPMMNVLSWCDNGSFLTVVFPRQKHRPDCYYAEGDEQLLVSPGAIDMAGLLITPREEDFRKLDAEKAVAILKECSLPPFTLHFNQ